jgi:ribosomal protein S18 acetylase RimI-like enzyme
MQNPENQKIKISQMQLEDIPKVFQLGEKLFTAEKWSNLYRTWDEYELLERYIGDHEFCIVAKIDNKLAGFAIGAIIEKRKSSWTYGYLIWIGVNPRIKIAGIGKKLMDKMTALFIKAGARIMMVDTEIENTRAKVFFEKNGFKEENEQIYFSKNLSSHPIYKKQKKDLSDKKESDRFKLKTKKIRHLFKNHL